MNSYPQSYNFYATSPSLPCIYSNFNTPSSSYCSCCYSSTPYYPQQTSPTFVFSPPTSPFIPQHTPISTPTVTTTQSIQTQQSSSKITRLQYTNKDRYILNELFKRTPYPNAIQRDLIAQQLGITSEQIRIWFQNRRRLQTQRDTGERLTTANEISALQQGKTYVNSNELKKLINEVAQYKNAPPRLRLNESS
ncbi:unnamed protein product [Rotaria sordida]|uniref:Homeobox domain-containing protein n=1 Tax=Rotaria sordida TaxID=392033 RepID=A0A813PLD0_9BILA|nr:unnamed protein product [Rotaria sordida]CAF0796708.1 unnamed protein product [Rotaria sordida]CAF0796792.1 unnamed protein product [Rotaria sordida]CAF3555649.1 unnamed protein product [Rotaria sordida]